MASEIEETEGSSQRMSAGNGARVHRKAGFLLLFCLCERLVFYIFLFLRCNPVCYQYLFEFVPLYRFYFHQLSRNSLKRLAVFFYDSFCFFVCAIDYLLNLGIYLRGYFLGLFISLDSLPKHGLAHRGVECDRSHLFRHTVSRDHVTRECGEDLEFIRSARRYVAEHHILCNISSERNGYVIQELLARLHFPVFERKLQRVARRAAARD